MFPIYNTQGNLLTNVTLEQDYTYHGLAAYIMHINFQNIHNVLFVDDQDRYITEYAFCIEDIKFALALAEKQQPPIIKKIKLYVRMTNKRTFIFFKNLFTRIREIKEEVYKKLQLLPLYQSLYYGGQKRTDEESTLLELEFKESGIIHLVDLSKDKQEEYDIYIQFGKNIHKMQISCNKTAKSIKQYASEYYLIDITNIGLYYCGFFLPEDQIIDNLEIAPGSYIIIVDLSQGKIVNPPTIVIVEEKAEEQKKWVVNSAIRQTNSIDLHQSAYSGRIVNQDVTEYSYQINKVNKSDLEYSKEESAINYFDVENKSINLIHSSERRHVSPDWDQEKNEIENSSKSIESINFS